MARRPGRDPDRYTQQPLFVPETKWRAPVEFMRLDGCKRISIDLETKDPSLNDLGPGVRRKDGHIVGIAIGTDDDGLGNGRRAYYPMRHEGGGNMDADMVLRWARHELNNFSGEVCGARLDYDLDWLYEDGITFPNVAKKNFLDVQIAEPLLNEHRFEYNLGALSNDYLGEGKDMAMLEEAAIVHGIKTKEARGNLWRMPAQFTGEYAESDVDLPLRIIPVQVAQLEKEGLLDVWQMESELITLLVAMRRRGIRVDLKRAEQVREELVRERAQLLAKLKKLAGPTAEFMAADSLVGALEARGLKVPRTVKMHLPSITKPFLEQNQGDELVDTISAGRKVNTIITTFMDGHIFTHAINGRIHCQFNQLKRDREGGGGTKGTIARFSSDTPNLQNLPARDERLGPLVRSVFVPEEGDDYQRCDYSQIEYRFLAHYAVGRGAEECRAAYNNDPKTDYHKLCAEFCHIDPEDKIKRKRVKNVNFAKGYGAGPAKLAVTMGCSLQEAIEFIAMYDKRLPFAKDTYQHFMRIASQRGEVRTIMGRKQRFPLWEPAKNYGDQKKPAFPRQIAVAKYGPHVVRADTYMAMNRVLQGSAADLMKKAMRDCWVSGIYDELGVPLVTVHDELGNSVSPDKRKAAEAALHVMENCMKLRVPIMVEAEYGANWGDCK